MCKLFCKNKSVFIRVWPKSKHLSVPLLVIFETWYKQEWIERQKHWKRPNKADGLYKQKIITLLTVANDKQTNSMEQSPTLEANSHSASQEISKFPGSPLSCSHKPTTNTYHEPDVSSPHLPALFP